MKLADRFGITEAVVKKAIPKLVAMFIPGAGFISAILSIYDTVMVFVQKIAKIIQVLFTSGRDWPYGAALGFILMVITLAGTFLAIRSLRQETLG